MNRIAREIAALLLAAVMLSAPTFLNGQPFIFTDSAGYMKLGASMGAFLTRGQSASETAAEASAEMTTPEREVAQAAAGGGEDVARALTHYGARSGHYSAFAFLLTAIGSIWLVTLTQALITAWVGRAALRAIAPQAGLGVFLAGAAILSLFSHAGFYAGYLMPDIFAGLALVSALLLAFYRERLVLLERLALAGLLIASALFHQTILGIIGIVFLVAIVFSPDGRRGWPALAAYLIGPIVAALAGVSVYKAVVEAQLGAPPRNPPFLMARVLADGPGRAYLPIACAKEDLAICQFRDRPLDDVNVFLWPNDPAVGVFGGADVATRERLLEEEMGFVLGAIAHQPLEQFQASLAAGLRQFVTINLRSALAIVVSPEEADAVFVTDPEGRAAFEKTLVAQGRFPFGPFDAATLVALALAIALLARIFLAKPPTDATEAAERRLALIVCGAALMGLLVNAGMCGALSAVNDRFQARVVWVVPLLALLYGLRFGALPIGRRAPA